MYKCNKTKEKADNFRNEKETIKSRNLNLFNCIKAIFEGKTLFAQFFLRNKKTNK